MNPPAFQFYVSNFIEGTAHMSDSEVGLFVRLLCAQWSRGSLPAADSELARFSHGSTTTATDLVMVKEKFEIGADGKLRNARMEAERKKQSDYREAQSEKGKLSAAIRANRKATELEPNGNNGSTEPHPSVEPEGNSLNSKLHTPSPIQSSTVKSFFKGGGTEGEAMDWLKAAVGEKTMANWGGLWRKRWRADQGKFDRVMAELARMQAEGVPVPNPGGCANDLWKRFK